MFNSVHYIFHPSLIEALVSLQGNYSLKAFWQPISRSLSPSMYALPFCSQGLYVQAHSGHCNHGHDQCNHGDGHCNYGDGHCDHGHGRCIIPEKEMLCVCECMCACVLSFPLLLLTLRVLYLIESLDSFNL